MHQAHAVGGRGEEGGAIAGDVVQTGVAICLLPGDATVVADREHPVAAAGISDAHQEGAVGHDDHLGLIAAVVGGLGDLPGLSQVVAVDETVVEGAALGVPHGGDIHDASVAGGGAMASGDEGGGVLPAIRIGAIGSVELRLHGARFAPGASVIGALHDVLRHRLVCCGAPEAGTSDECDDQLLSMTGLDDADVAIAGASALSAEDDLGIGPGLAIVLTSAQDQVDVLRDVGLIVFSPVRKGEEGPLGGLDESRDAEVARAGVTRDEEGRVGAPALTGDLLTDLLNGIAPSIDGDGEDLASELVRGVEGILRHIGGEVEDPLVCREAGAILPSQRDRFVRDSTLVVIEITNYEAVAGKHFASLHESLSAGVEVVGDVDASAPGEDDGGERSSRLAAHVAVPRADHGDRVGLGMGERAEEDQGEGIDDLTCHGSDCVKKD